MATVRTINRLITAILSDILNVYHPGESLDNADVQTVFHAIQDRLSDWTDDITIPVVITEYFAMVSGTASYTVGQTGAPTVNSVRPESIVGAYVHEGDYDYPVKIITEAVYRSIYDKASTGRPTQCYPNYGTPNVTLYLHPVPDSTDNFYFASLKPMTEPTGYTQDTFVTLGIPGYIYNALKWRVAIDVAPGFAKPITPEMKYNEEDSFNRMTAKHLARSMNGAVIELAYSGSRKGTYTKSEFFAGK
jgi:hypothetical protein